MLTRWIFYNLIETERRYLMNILYIDASVRPDSRTKRLAHHFFKGIEELNANVKELYLTNECIPPLNRESLEHRTQMCEEGNLDEPIFHYAKEYANADMIVIAAPYWDLSFPAILKTYIEAINVVGITFRYDEDGVPAGLCNAKKLVYITTAGGKIISDDYGFGYVKELAQKFHGIKDVEYIKAEELDIIDADVDNIIQKAQKKIDKLSQDIIKELK